VATIALAPTRLGRSARALLIGALLVAAGVAWAVTDLRMAGMGGGTELGALGFYVGVWVVMMAAMMFPSVWPMIVAYHAIAHRRRELGKPAPAAGGIVFLAGYLIAWTLYGLTAYGAIEAVRALDVEALGWNRGGPYVAGAVIVAAAAYQLTPAKDVCLRKCRSPMHFFFGIWRDGVSGVPADGDRARRLVRRLLLGAHGRVVRARCDEPWVDGVRRRAHRDRETAPVEGACKPRRGRGARRPGACGHRKPGQRAGPRADVDVDVEEAHVERSRRLDVAIHPLTAILAVAASSGCPGISADRDRCRVPSNASDPAERITARPRAPLPAWAWTWAPRGADFARRAQQAANARQTGHASTVLKAVA
jgi:Predicted metal-binding integral membrane protein (DUF2182)